MSYRAFVQVSVIATEMSFVYRVVESFFDPAKKCKYRLFIRLDAGEISGILGTYLALCSLFRVDTMFNVLVIDDDADVRESLRKVLVRLGCDVAISDTAEHGVSQLEKIKFDAVFAALCVRTMGGRGVARWVKNSTTDTKFFIVTSWKGDLEINLLRMDGIHDVIHKPFIFSEIRDKVLEHLG